MATPQNPLSNSPAETHPGATPPPQKTICEFCECQLTPTGEIIRMGERAKKFRKHEEDIDKLNETISRQQTEITALKAQLAEQVPSVETSRRRDGILVSSNS